MKIAVIATHSFPIPYKTHTGDAQLIQDLCEALRKLGHHVTLYAPEGTTVECRVREAPLCSYGQAEPTVQACESALVDMYGDELLRYDIVHDFSINKTMASFRCVQNLPHIQTYLGAPYDQGPHQNCCVQSKAQAERASRGATDYEGTKMEAMGGLPSRPINARPVYDGINEEFYCPSSDTPREDFFLWMNRWHPAKGYLEFLEIAKAHPHLPFLIAGEHPDREMFEYQAQCAREAESIARELPNVELVWLPPDPDHHIAKRELYRRANALIYTVQFQEPFGLCQTEAQMCGCPVYANPYGSCPELADGFLTELRPDDIKEHSQAYRDQLRAITVEQFSAKAMAERYLEAYTDIIEGRGWQ